MKIAFFCVALCALLANSALAATNVACVDTVAKLADALSNLSTATTNTDADEIRVIIGNYDAPAGGFVGSVTNHHNLTIRGGYVDAACTQQVTDPELTVLDGKQAAAGVLTINTIAIPNSDIEVSGLTFQNGSAGGGFGSNAGGLKIGDPNPISGGKILVERNIFRNNSSASSVGGLLAATDGTPLIVRDNLFVGNISPNASAALFYSNFEIDVSNNTFTGNQSTDTGLRVTIDYTAFTGLKLSNNIFWGNHTDGVKAFDVDMSRVPPDQFGVGASLANNDVEAKTGTAVSETGTLHVDPAFVGNGDFRLAASSPLIDAGVNDPAGGLAAVDLDGAPRVDGTTVDLGAYESSYVFVSGFD